jgi:hypothetical protein
VFCSFILASDFRNRPERDQTAAMKSCASAVQSSQSFAFPPKITRPHFFETFNTISSLSIAFSSTTIREFASRPRSRLCNLHFSEQKWPAVDHFNANPVYVRKTQGSGSWFSLLSGWHCRGRSHALRQMTPQNGIPTLIVHDGSLPNVR